MPSENGWEPLDIRPGDARLKWFAVPGTNPPVNLQLNTERDAHKVMLAFAAEFNRRIEKLRDPDSAAYTDGNKIFTSNHKNATAMDLNWNGADGKTFRYGIPMERAYPGDKSQKIRQLLDDFEGLIYCGGFWDIQDWMHFQIGYNVWSNPAMLRDFVNNKIDSNGFFKSGVPVPTPQPQPSDNAVKVLYDAVPVIDMDRSKFLLPLVSRGLKLCKAQTPKEIAIWLANMGHESDGFATTEEYKKDGRYAPYIGRTWVQITWEYNYREFGQWCVQQGFLDDPEFFVRNPVRLADSQWAGIGPAWYCTVKEPRYLQFATAGDIENSAKAINAPAWIGKPQRANGIDDRIKRYNQAIALGDRLLLLLGLPDEEMVELPESVTRAQWDELFRDVKEIRAQLGGDSGWPQLGGRSIVDALSYVMKFMPSRKTPVIPPTPDKEAKPK